MRRVWSNTTDYLADDDSTLSSSIDHVQVRTTWKSMPPFCRYCHSPDHALADCTLRQTSTVCHLCNETGHIARQCPRKNPSTTPNKRRKMSSHLSSTTVASSTSPDSITAHTSGQDASPQPSSFQVSTTERATLPFNPTLKDSNSSSETLPPAYLPTLQGQLSEQPADSSASQETTLVFQNHPLPADPKMSQYSYCGQADAKQSTPLSQHCLRHDDYTFLHAQSFTKSDAFAYISAHSVIDRSQFDDGNNSNESDSMVL
ncbi:MAG: hypothetical protein EXX96DRAFT_646843 [Benjaminiella poitrasii]|nr:MAG: hypothetical protein EXX96DRAFT_646843 [Benjaminiella poitrasii]